MIYVNTYGIRIAAPGIHFENSILSTAMVQLAHDTDNSGIFGTNSPTSFDRHTISSVHSLASREKIGVGKKNNATLP